MENEKTSDDREVEYSFFEIDKSFDPHSLSSFILYVFFESLDSSLLFTYFLSPSTPSSEAMPITSFSLSIFAS